MVLPFAVIGAGPMGLATAKCLAEQGIAFQGFELHSDVGGLWDIEGPLSTMYDSAHLISSRTKTEFADFPMSEGVADFPSHRVLRDYFRAFADQFDLRSHYRFGAEVLRCEPLDDGWRVVWRQNGAEHEGQFAGVLIANGTLSEPNMPVFNGHFDGEVIHSGAYRQASQMAGKRVLVIAGQGHIAVINDFLASDTQRKAVFVDKFL
jgi:cation diffusion facilitator CzcD-associated flavoprotein CzcO